ncbi:hypothetical protein FHN55_05070 [Streptomyces sp. NP160]|uniref:hypothetical protein n=1 Tax=Streptomyces sp. NP160 TaxID=2586637 RepID=UPI0011185F12|nr:hypothetical protein [Streptomyces sp. NP160]TNM69157.1 hypothetical protein FHN55_05070 [Streptomyces sp. NP160]
MTAPRRRFTPAAAALLDGAVVQWEDVVGNPDGTVASRVPRQGRMTLPPSLVSGGCPGCGSTAPGTEAPDFDHVNGCTIAEELAGETVTDLAALHRLRDAGLPARTERATTGAEADCWQARGVTATTDRVVVELALDGTRTRWWPRVQR